MFKQFITPTMAGAYAPILGLITWVDTELPLVYLSFLMIPVLVSVLCGYFDLLRSVTRCAAILAASALGFSLAICLTPGRILNHPLWELALSVLFAIAWSGAILFPVTWVLVLIGRFVRLGRNASALK